MSICQSAACPPSADFIGSENNNQPARLEGEKRNYSSDNASQPLCYLPVVAHILRTRKIVAGNYAFGLLSLI